jgi:hypothetical protein
MRISHTFQQRRTGIHDGGVHPMTRLHRTAPRYHHIEAALPKRRAE